MKTLSVRGTAASLTIACLLLVLLTIVFGTISNGDSSAYAAELGAPKPDAGSAAKPSPTTGVPSVTPTVTSTVQVPSPTARKQAPTFTPAPATVPPGQTATATPTALPSSTATPASTASPTPTVAGSLTITPTVTPTALAKSNDDFDAATLVSVFPFTVTQDTTAATVASDDPDMLAGAGVNSNTVWFKFVPPSSGGLTVSTSGSNYDTVLAAFTGARGALSIVYMGGMPASNDDARADTTSQIAFNVQAGSTYYVEAAQYDTPAGGNLRLAASLGSPIVPTANPSATSTPTVMPTMTPWPTSTPWPAVTPYPTATVTPTVVPGAPPANDSIGSATIVGSLPFITSLDTTGATTASDDPDMGNGAGRNSNTVWFKLSPASAGSVRVSTSGSSYDTVLAVFSGIPGSLSLVGSNDDVVNSATSYNGTSEVTFNALAGTTYYVEAAQYGGERAGGNLVVSVDGAVGVAAASPVTTPVSAAVAGFAPAPVPRLVVRDSRYFSQTGFRIDDESFYDYFLKRGGVRTFGYPVSWEFDLLGFKVQFFQRGILQKMSNSSVASMNLLDEGLMPYNRINSSVFPSPERELKDAAPSPSDPEYGAKAMAFLQANVPDEWDGKQVNFLEAFMSTVRYEDAFPMGEGDPGLVPMLNLELYGLPTSKPAYDPNNHDFIYQRFQRGILHYDARTGATQGLLLADYLKSIITGQNLPADLDAQAKISRFYRQYDQAKQGGVARPQLLPGTSLTGAFGRDGS